MGNKHTIEDDLITFKLTSKQMLRSSEKCKKNAELQTAKLKKAIADKNLEGARIYAQNVIREKNQALTFLRLSSRIDAVASRLETSIRMQAVNTAMGQTVQSMTSAMKSMNVDQISKTMTDFEKSFEDMDVRSGYMEQSMENTTSLSTPPDQVDNLIQMVADENQLELSGLLDSAGVVGTKIPAQENKVADDSLEARLAKLRN